MQRKPLKIYACGEHRFGPVRIISGRSPMVGADGLRKAGNLLAQRLYDSTPSPFYQGAVAFIFDMEGKKLDPRAAILEKQLAEQRDSLNKLGALCTKHEQARDAAQAEAAKLRLELAQRRDATSLNRELNDMSMRNAQLRDQLVAAQCESDKYQLELQRVRAEHDEALDEVKTARAKAAERFRANEELGKVIDQQRARLSAIRFTLGTKPSEEILEAARRVVRDRQLALIRADRVERTAQFDAVKALETKLEAAQRSITNWERKYDRIRRILDPWQGIPEHVYNLRQLAAYRMGQCNSLANALRKYPTVDFNTLALRAGEQAAKQEGENREAE